MKKSFSLLSTILLILVFSSISVIMFENKSINNVNLKNQYLYIQGKNHLDFLEEYIKSINLDDVNKIEIENKNFEIYAKVEKKTENFEINLYSKSKTHNIALHKTILITRN